MCTLPSKEEQTRDEIEDSQAVASRYRIAEREMLIVEK